ncbi:50S ribosomal protein L29 [Candidatus Pacearchaeota archaeon CG10_big_fil_rev_8_21_14_0_10_34_76]|nr:MAG: 50S ribosomal protein L29 [Candidatus Pacearchaeota archaeon CG10_big_fil_rev_8_21_14_0_10_34_76]
MAILRSKDIRKMDEKNRKERLKDLRMELTKANVTAHKTNAKTKEIKRAIARILTITKAEKSAKVISK